MDVFGMMANKVLELLKVSSAGFTYSLPEGVDWSRPHVFVSNHRDIMLDASLLEVMFHMEGLPQPAALAGSNLMTHPQMIKVCRANKVFCMDRGDGSKMAFYRCLQETSQRIREHVDEGTSVWVAQRNGRTKDGVDRTDPAVLKMLSLSGGKDKMQALRDLRIAPMSISYEWEPCDLLKAREMMMRERDGVYHKQPHEDENSIMTGIRQWKGRIHLAVGRPLEIEADDDMESIARRLDGLIGEGYRLWPNNYIACDLLDGSRQHADRYTGEEEAAFEKHLAEAGEEVREKMLAIYAGPIMKKEE